MSSRAHKVASGFLGLQPLWQTAKATQAFIVFYVKSPLTLMHSLHFATEGGTLIQLNEVLCQVSLLKGIDLLHQLYCEHRYESVKQMIDVVHLWCRSPDMHKKYGL